MKKTDEISKLTVNRVPQKSQDTVVATFNSWIETAKNSSR